MCPGMKNEWYSGGIPRTNRRLINLAMYLREQRQRGLPNPRFSLRQVAGRVGIEPSYLSKVERAIGPPPSEETLKKLAADLDLDTDFVLAYAGKVSSDVQAVIRRRPILFARLIRKLGTMPDQALSDLVYDLTAL